MSVFVIARPESRIVNFRMPLLRSIANSRRQRIVLYLCLLFTIIGLSSFWIIDRGIGSWDDSVTTTKKGIDLNCNDGEATKTSIETAGAATSVKLETTNTEPQNPTSGSLTIKAKSSSTFFSPPSTPKSPGLQFIFLIHYHKTGHDLVTGYMKTVQHFLSRNETYRTIVVIKARSGRYKRMHHEKTGCPYLWIHNGEDIYHNITSYDIDEMRHKDKDLHTVRQSLGQINLLHLIAPDFMCNLYENDVFMQKNKGRNDESHKNASALDSVKIIHLIRDPFDMVISNYLYHSQKPTPESWVKEVRNPCSINHMSTVAVDEYGAELLTQHQIQRLESMCNTLMTNTTSGVPYDSFYEALLGLPRLNGLWLSAIYCLIGTSRSSGADILRMTNNIIHLNEWQRLQRLEQQEIEQNGGSSNNSTANEILSFSMEKDWTKDNYRQSLNRLSESLVMDLQFPNDNESTEQRKQYFVTSVADIVMSQLSLKLERKTNHITSNRLDDDRSQLEESLRAHELLGPILLKLQTIVKGSTGLKKYQTN